MNRIGILVFVFLFFTAISCTDNSQAEKGRVLASAYGYNLYLSDIVHVVPNTIKGQDSVLFVQNYINRWLQEKAILYHSLSNLGDELIDLEAEIENYRNSLLIYNYQKRFIQQNMDTNVTDAEISDYYSSHKEDFILKDNIVKVIFIKFEKEARNIREAGNLLKNFKPEDKEKLKDLAERYAINYFLDDDAWLLFKDLLKEVPIQTYNEDVFLKNNKYLELTDSLYKTLVLINGFRVKESTSPLSFEYDRIKMIILNKRKQMLLKKLEDDIIQKAIDEGAFEINN